MGKQQTMHLAQLQIKGISRIILVQRASQKALPGKNLLVNLHTHHYKNKPPHNKAEIYAKTERNCHRKRVAS